MGAAYILAEVFAGGITAAALAFSLITAAPGMERTAPLAGAVLQNPAQREVVLTGREPADWMLAAADYCTEMQCRRHPYEKGIAAREGVEY